MSDLTPEPIDVPFHFRHCCWFCSEPAANEFTFPHQRYLVISCPHIPLIVPSCKECMLLAYKVKADTIWQVNFTVKKMLIKKYQTHLAIGINWTKQELENSDFDGGNFEGFKRSAWFMFEIAKTRVNFKGWPLAAMGIDIEEVFSKETFSFDGVIYPSIDEAIMQYTQNFGLPSGYLKETLNSIGTSEFSQAIRFCRLMVGSTPVERKLALRELVFTEEVIRSFNQS